MISIVPHIPMTFRCKGKGGMVINHMMAMMYMKKPH